jgi:hypothetical protein
MFHADPSHFLRTARSESPMIRLNLARSQLQLGLRSHFLASYQLVPTVWRLRLRVSCQLGPFYRHVAPCCSPPAVYCYIISNGIFGLLR